MNHPLKKPLFPNWNRYFHLIRLSAIAHLKAETHRSYLGYLWWIFEPLLNTFLFYTLFFLFLSKRTNDYLQFLLIGTILWQWIQTTLQLTSTSILDKPHILRQIKIPLTHFPITKTVANTIKFIIVYLLLLIYLIPQGYTPTIHWLQIPPLIALHTILILSFSIPIAIFVTFVSDLKSVLDAILRFLMLISGIFFTSEAIPSHLKFYFYLNPIAHILESHRQILLHASAPAAHHWLYPMAIIAILTPLNILLIRIADGRVTKVLK